VVISAEATGLIDKPPPRPTPGDTITADHHRNRAASMRHWRLSSATRHRVVRCEVCGSHHRSKTRLPRGPKLVLTPRMRRALVHPLSSNTPPPFRRGGQGGWGSATAALFTPPYPPF